MKERHLSSVETSYGLKAVKSPNELAIRNTIFRPPLVSVIVVNHNYGRFLSQAICSVYGQSYPNIECIVVDDASTDDTAETLDAIKAQFPQMVIVRRSRNGGQSAASLDGLHAASGTYVILMDADDVLLTRGVELHIAAHLSLRVHVGLTSGDMLQAVDNQIVVATGEEFNRHIRKRAWRRRNLVRPYHDIVGANWPPDSLTESIANKIHVVPAGTTRWIWSPSSGICYRRDAMSLFMDNPALLELRSGTDLYFTRAIGGLCGGALIDEPVFVYRIHGKNLFSRQPQLNHFQAYKAGVPGDNNDNARMVLVDHVTEKARRFCQNNFLKLNFVYLLGRLDCSDPDSSQPRWRRRSRVAARLVDNYAQMTSALGVRYTKLLMVLFRVPLKIIFKI